ncbi:hypothetical protein ES703_87785 [subsurface metagenome]
MYTVLPCIAVNEVVSVVIRVHNPRKGQLVEIVKTNGPLTLFSDPV